MTAQPKPTDDSVDDNHDASAIALADMLAADLIGPTNLVVEVTDPKKSLSSAGIVIPPLFQLKELYKTKSAIIRHLTEIGMTVKEISAHTGIRYQHVRNVVTTELKRGPNEPVLAKQPAQQKGDNSDA